MSPTGVNMMLFLWISSGASKPAALSAWSALAEWPVYALPLLVGLCWLVGRRSDRDAAVAAGLTACLAMAAAHVVSTLIIHPRPFMFGLAPNTFNHAPDSSFPSDHATLFFALAATFWHQPASRLRWLGGLIGVVGLGVGLARIALGLHFPADVVGAAAIGTASAYAVSSRPGRLVSSVLSGIGERVRGRVPGLPRRDDQSALARSDARPAG